MDAQQITLLVTTMGFAIIGNHYIHLSQVLSLFQQFSQTCVNPSQVLITDTLKSGILSNHNQYRNRIALGQQPGFSSARRMAQMVWNDELAWLAQLNTKQCKMNHDKCHNTATFLHSGQNLGNAAKSSAHYDPSAFIVTIIDLWFSENTSTMQSDIDNLTSIIKKLDRIISHIHF